MTRKAIPLLQNKHYRSAAVFTPTSLLREARRQKSLPAGDVPAVCVLDPDGDTVAYLRRQKLAEPNRFWACYHTILYQFRLNRVTCGIIGCAVGGPFAVLLAEQLFVRVLRPYHESDGRSGGRLRERRSWGQPGVTTAD